MALGVTPEGEREVLGLWIADNEGAKFWLSIMNNLKNRGLEDILIAVVDGLNASLTPSTQLSPIRRFKPVSCTLCATSAAGRIARLS